MDKIDDMMSWPRYMILPDPEKSSTLHQNVVLQPAMPPMVLEIFMHLYYILKSVHEFFQVVKHIQTHTQGV